MKLFGASTESLPVEGRLADFDGATGWLNSEPLTTDGLRGKVVLVDFWTYTCINWLRTLAWIRAWAERYEDDGLVVVGVHTPEFPFERDDDNVRRAVAEMRVDYPVAIDSRYEVWRAFANSYWPAVYIADAEGRIRHHQFGEGGYEECERVVQQLLREAGREVDGKLVEVAPEGFEVQADWSTLESPETYLGYEQAQNFASARGARRRLRGAGSAGAQPVGAGRRLDRRPRRGQAERRRGPDRVPLPRARRPPRDGAGDSARSLCAFRVLLDGEPPGDAHGFDVDELGQGTLSRAAAAPVDPPARAESSSGRSRSSSSRPAPRATASPSARGRPYNRSVADGKALDDRQLDAVLERLDGLRDELRALNQRLDHTEGYLALAHELRSLNESLQALAYAALGQQGPQVRRRRTG